jgi:hypothetical protein
MPRLLSSGKVAMLVVRLGAGDPEMVIVGAAPARTQGGRCASGTSTTEDAAGR